MTSTVGMLVLVCIGVDVRIERIARVCVFMPKPEKPTTKPKNTAKKRNTPI